MATFSDPRYLARLLTLADPRQLVLLASQTDDPMIQQAVAAEVIRRRGGGMQTGVVRPPDHITSGNELRPEDYLLPPEGEAQDGPLAALRQDEPEDYYPPEEDDQSAADGEALGADALSLRKPAPPVHHMTLPAYDYSPGQSLASDALSLRKPPAPMLRHLVLPTVDDAPVRKPVTILDRRQAQLFAPQESESDRLNREELEKAGPARRAAQRLAAQGRNGDDILAHISPEEAALLKARGGAGTINPVTGLPEFYTDAFGGGFGDGGATDAGGGRGYSADMGSRGDALGSGGVSSGGSANPYAMGDHISNVSLANPDVYGSEATSAADLAARQAAFGGQSGLTSATHGAGGNYTGVGAPAGGLTSLSSMPMAGNSTVADYMQARKYGLSPDQWTEAARNLRDSYGDYRNFGNSFLDNVGNYIGDFFGVYEDNPMAKSYAALSKMPGLGTTGQPAQADWGFHPFDAPAIGMALGAANPILGVGYGLLSALVNGRPLGALQSIMPGPLALLSGAVPRLAGYKNLDDMLGTSYAWNEGMEPGTSPSFSLSGDGDSPYNFGYTGTGGTWDSNPVGALAGALSPWRGGGGGTTTGAGQSAEAGGSGGGSVPGTGTTGGTGTGTGGGTTGGTTDPGTGSPSPSSNLAYNPYGKDYYSYAMGPEWSFYS